MTEPLYRDDAYLRECSATVTAINERGGVVLDRTVFYPTGGGQPGERGALEWQGGETAIAVAVKGETADEVVHVPDEGATLPPVGAQVTARLDWDTRYRHMRVHTGLHLLSVVIPLPVTGGSIGTAKACCALAPMATPSTCNPAAAPMCARPPRSARCASARSRRRAARTAGWRS